MKRRNSAAVTRREAVAALSLLGAPAAQAQPQSAAQDELAAVRQQTQRTIEQLRRVKLPIATEPSFSFRP